MRHIFSGIAVLLLLTGCASPEPEYVPDGTTGGPADGAPDIAGDGIVGSDNLPPEDTMVDGQDDAMGEGEGATDEGGLSAQTDDTPQDLPEGYAMDEIALHDNKDDCWLLIEGKIYDVSEYTKHPGGDNQLVRGCGIDATALFNTQGGKDPEHGHSKGAENQLDNFYIGDFSG